jgi:GH18 family chitinase
MAVYASAAADSGGFYNIAALAPAVDGFFVMAYDMNSKTTPSATSPLVGGGSYSDTEALQQFTAVVPASKVILGVPYYGYDWPTTDGTSAAQATGPESPLSDGVIAASGHPTYWDPTTQTAWTSYQVGTQWHETYFDNPTSLALKAQLANLFHIGGVGIWALGMDGNNPAMLAALLGNSPAVKDYEVGPTVTSSSASSTTQPGPAGSGFSNSSTCLTKRSTWIGPFRRWPTRAGAPWWNGSPWDPPRSASWQNPWPCPLPPSSSTCRSSRRAGS